MTSGSVITALLMICVASLIIAAFLAGRYVERTRHDKLYSKQRAVWYDQLIRLGIDPADPLGKHTPETHEGVRSWTGEPTAESVTRGIGAKVRWDETRTRR